MGDPRPISLRALNADSVLLDHDPITSDDTIALGHQVKVIRAK
jgi:hypothetical protein